MLVPKFEIHQNDIYVLLDIEALYTKVSEVEISVNENCFLFYAKPYFLRLQFDEELLEEGSDCKFSADDGKYYARLKKAQRGVKFKNLDLLKSIVTPIPKKTAPAIEVIDQGDDVQQLCGSDFDWLAPPDAIISSSPQFGYGFANQKSDVISKLQEDLVDIVYLKDPDETSLGDRCILREEAEELKFDSDYYLADLYESDEIDELLHYKPWWCEEEQGLNEKEKDELQKLPNRKYLLSATESRMLFLALYDIVFAYAYHVRSTLDDDENTEAAWTVRTLSPTLSWCDTRPTLTAVLTACYRRSLCYPQYRNWKFTEAVSSDVVKILRRGRRSVLKCLLNIYELFKKSDGSPCYVLNDLYIKDYCIWTHCCADIDAALTSLADVAETIHIRKSDVNLEIDEIELAASLVFAEEEEENEEEESSEGENDSVSILPGGETVVPGGETVVNQLTDDLASFTIGSEPTSHVTDSAVSLPGPFPRSKPLVEIINDNDGEEKSLVN